MTEPIRARKGDWVEVECTLLDPADRSKNLPPETAEKPLMMWVKGFAQGEAGMGEQLTIETMTETTRSWDSAGVCSEAVSVGTARMNTARVSISPSAE